MPADEYPEGSGSGIDSEAVFVMDPQAVVWQLARMLISGQHMVVSMRRAAEAARQSASVTPEEAAKFFADYERFKNRWHNQTLPGVVASFKLAVEVYDTFGPGLTSVQDGTDAVS